MTSATQTGCVVAESHASLTPWGGEALTRQSGAWMCETVKAVVVCGDFGEVSGPGSVVWHRALRRVHRGLLWGLR